MTSGVSQKTKEDEDILSSKIEIWVPPLPQESDSYSSVLNLCIELEEVRSRFIEVIEICSKYSIILKVTKTQTSFQESEFFGYTVTTG